MHTCLATTTVGLALGTSQPDKPHANAFTHFSLSACGLLICCCSVPPAISVVVKVV